MARKALPLHNRILLWILAPVIVVGLGFSGFLIYRMSAPMVGYLTRYFKADLRLASGLALEICEDRFDYLLDLRLEESPEMNEALRREALEQIKAISRRLPDVHLAVLDADGKVLASSLNNGDPQLEMPPQAQASREVFECRVGGQRALAHVRYFPLWRWRLVSFTMLSDYVRPVHVAQNTIYLSMLGVFLAICITLVVVFHRFIDNPLNKMIRATEGVSEGKLNRIERVPRNELGRLMESFNMMIDSLGREQREVRSLIAQLRGSEERLRTLFESAPAGICVAREDGTMLEVNRALADLCGCDPENPEEMNLIDLFNDQSQGKALLQALQAGSAFETMEAAMVCAEGKRWHSHILVRRLRLGEQNLLYAIFEDVSEQREMEEQLKQTRKMEAIGSLAGGVAHDFNNLLTPILGYTGMLLEDLPSGDTNRSLVGEIQMAARRAKEIVRQLLAFSRKQTLEFKPVDLNEVVGQFQKLLRRTIRENIEIELALAPDLKTVYADINQIDQMVMNLAVNAQDAMPSGGRMILETRMVVLDEAYAETHRGVRPGEYVLLAVSDSGCGMGAETLDRIFEPFFSTKAEHGTGLGLATVYGIVKQHDGYIWVYSEPGQGTTFKVYLPVSAAEQVAQAPTADTAARMPGGSETILLAEDSDQVRLLSRTILERRGYRVLPAACGEEALRILEASPQSVDLLLTDVVMPGMNGKELYDKAAAVCPGLRVLYMSGYTDEVIARSGVIDPEVDFIQKPFATEAILAKVRAVLDAESPPNA